MAATPGRSIRVPDEVWDAAGTRARREGTTLTAVVVARLAEYGQADESETNDD